MTRDEFESSEYKYFSPFQEEVTTEGLRHCNMCRAVVPFSHTWNHYLWHREINKQFNAIAAKIGVTLNENQD